jgi:hypothetical protein
MEISSMRRYVVEQPEQRTFEIQCVGVDEEGSYFEVEA